MLGRLRVGHNRTVLEVDHEIGRYYRKLFLGTFGIKLERPSNSEHITVVSEYDVLYDKSKLMDFQGYNVIFRVVPEVWTNQNAFWLPVLSNVLGEIREAVGLPYEPDYGFHFCIGYLNNGPTKQD